MSVFRTGFATVLVVVAAFSTTGYLACKKDPCKGVSCKNGGSCADGKCNCPAGFEGLDCSTRATDKFLGTWNGDETCSSGEYTLSSEIKAGSNPSTIIVSNPGGYGDTETIMGMLTAANKVSFNDHDLDGTVKLSGVMTYSDGKLNFVYIAGSGPDADSCFGVYTK